MWPVYRKHWSAAQSDNFWHPAGFSIVDAVQLSSPRTENLAGLQDWVTPELVYKLFNM